MKNKLSHMGIYIDDMDRAKKFYNNLFGWEFNNYGPSDFAQITANGQLVGALQARKYSPINEKIIGYECTIAVDNIDESITAINENGGNLIMPKTEIPGVGLIAKFLDTEGNLLCIMQYHR